MMANRSMAACARMLLGIPFLHRGRSRRGLDCAGVVWLSRKMAYGIDDDDRGYPRRPTSRMLMEKMLRHGVRVAVSAIRPDDVVVLRFASFATHLGVLTTSSVIHSVPGFGVIETSRESLAAEGKILAAFRLVRV